jgi:hypothetical protein
LQSLLAICAARIHIGICVCVCVCVCVYSEITRHNILPLNPEADGSGFIYTYNNIFFCDVRDTRDELPNTPEGIEAAYKCANNDLLGGMCSEPPSLYASCLSNTSAPPVLQYSIAEGIHSVLVALVTCQGRRYLAQSLVPGVLLVDQPPEVLYGFSDV